VTALLIDVGDVPDCTCTSMFDHLFKSLSEEPDGTESLLWSPHANEWLRAHVEDMTGRFQRILQAIQEAISRLVLGEPLDRLMKSEVPWLRWDQGRYDATKARLEAKGPEHFTLDDWLEVVDLIIQRYLPDAVIQSEAQYLAVRAQFAGMIQANMDHQQAKLNMPEIDRLMHLLPTDFRQIPPKVLSPIERSILDVSVAHTAQAISDVTESARSRMKRICIEHIQAQVLGQAEGQWTHLRQRLFDEFGQLNRDFRRIAITEAGEACNSGFVASQRPGTALRRQEAYKGACPFCKSINGKVFEVVDPAKADKNGETQVWLGKTNIGRSAAPRMRQGSTMVERPSAERWWPAAGVQHPNCRGSWAIAQDQPTLPPGVDSEFAAWLKTELAKVEVKPPR